MGAEGHPDLAAAAAAHRVRMPRQERRHVWLPPLLDAYALIDASVAAAIAAAGRGAACRKGCHGCCHQPVPVTPPEILGLRLYARELMPPAVRSALASRAAAADSGFSCRFLLAGACGAYPVRPIACRRYIVLGRPCAEGEDASVTRPGDMLRPSRPALNQALALTLPLYAAENPPGPMPGPEAAFAFCSARGVLLSDVSGRILG